MKGELPKAFVVRAPGSELSEEAELRATFRGGGEKMGALHQIIHSG